MMTRSSGVSMPLFMHVGVVRIRTSSSRTERLPSQATLNPRSYIQRPTTQRSARCSCSDLCWPGEIILCDMGATPDWRGTSTAERKDTHFGLGALVKKMEKENGSIESPGLDFRKTYASTVVENSS